ncbi:hypothetical protein FHT78_002739 [Rhizobium sp. BK196]|nr:hypothetical protein [Rhizobium sp. BK196]
MSRYVRKDPNTYLHRIPLNAGGYAKSGVHWGAGEPLWCVQVDAPGNFEGWYLRAPNRDAAKAATLERRPDAVFFH